MQMSARNEVPIPHFPPHINHTHCGRRRLICRSAISTTMQTRALECSSKLKACRFGLSQIGKQQLEYTANSPQSIVNANEIRISPAHFISIRKWAISLRRNRSAAASRGKCLSVVMKRVQEAYGKIFAFGAGHSTQLFNSVWGNHDRYAGTTYNLKWSTNI